MCFKVAVGEKRGMGCQAQTVETLEAHIHYQSNPQGGRTDRSASFCCEENFEGRW